MMVKCLPHIKYLKCSIAHTTPDSSSLFTEYFPELDASQTMRVSRCWSKCLFCVILANNFKCF